VREALSAAGFAVERVPGTQGKREMTRARFAPAPTALRHGPPPGRRALPNARHALVIGAGLAGASAARALAREGLRVTVLDAGSAPASCASGNLAGLYHGVVHAQDGAHAQLLRAAALRAEQHYRPLIDGGHIPGAACGLLRGAGSASLADLQLLAAAQAVPPGFAEPVDAARAGALAGCTVTPAAWWYYPGGGWLQPAAVVGHWLAQPGVTLMSGCTVSALHTTLNINDTGRWQAWGHAQDEPDAPDSPLADADLVVLACADAVTALLAPHTDAASWPWRRTRGQITVVPERWAAALPAAALPPESPHPGAPLASGGYLIRLPNVLGGGLLCGATSDRDDDDSALRAADHRANLAQIESLTGATLHAGWLDGAMSGLGGRVGWRLSTDDRLPVVGPVPMPPAALSGRRQLEQPRHVPRLTGLYVLTGLGSRGITWAPLLGEVIAAWISGSPMPLPSSLVDAIDPARFVSRGVRRPGR
jgi:tRNA 5-methylaminomethyl-2-thiouridine biosynthesis bifunctional protein